MLSLFSIVFTFLALILIPCLLFSRRLRVGLSLTNILRLFRLAEEDETNDKRSTMGETEKQVKNKFPDHVAIILDGNRRWAKKRGLGTSEGHDAGMKKLMEGAKDCFAMGINTVSIFAFSTENWGRSKRYFRSLKPNLHREKVKISVIGNRTRIPKALQVVIEEVEEATKSFQGKHLILAIDYSERFDILQACKSLAEKTKNGLIQVEDIDEKAIENELMTKCSEFPNPDLLIRPSGEQRISNFFLWQSAYSELYFPQVMWPDFGKPDYLQAFTWYQQRQRRFGRRV